MKIAQSIFLALPKERQDEFLLSKDVEIVADAPAAPAPVVPVYPSAPVAPIAGQNPFTAPPAASNPFASPTAAPSVSFKEIRLPMAIQAADGTTLYFDGIVGGAMVTPQNLKQVLGAFCDAGYPLNFRAAYDKNKYQKKF